MSLDDHDIALVRAANPGSFTLTGTNTYVVGRDPAWILDPGPDLPDHIDAVVAEAERRGGAGGIVVTHGHGDHGASLDAVAERTGASRVAVAAGERAGPFEAVATPGHTDDHLAFVAGSVAFTGDAVLGEGSVFIVARLGEYLQALADLRDRGLDLLCPGHGPVVEDPAAKLEEYIAHRLDRERKLLAALDAGARSVDEMLDAAWDDAPSALRTAAAATLGAHLEKLEAEGRLPDGVERPVLPPGLRAP